MPVEIKVPTLGESIVEATIGKWLKQVGDTVAAGDTLVELETDKVNGEVPAEQAGVLGQILKDEGQNVGVGEVIGTLDTDASGGTARQDGARAASAVAPAASTTPAAPPSAATLDQPRADDTRAPASPVARRIAADQG